MMSAHRPPSFLIRLAVLFGACTACLLGATTSGAEDVATPAQTPPPPPQVAVPPPPGLPPPNRPGARFAPPRMHPVPHPGMQNPNAPLLEKVSPGVFALGPIEINRQTMSVSFPATVNQNKGLLEYLLVRTGGKTHESLLRTTVDPSALQIALLLLGLEGADKPLAFQGDPNVPKGNPVEVKVFYMKDGRMQPLQPEAWMVKKSDDGAGAGGPLDWMYTGSMIRNGRFMAQAEGSIIAVYHDPVAMIDNASPGGENNRIWFVNETTVPQVGTPVTVIISVKH